MATFNVLNKGLHITAIKRKKFKYLSYIKAYFSGMYRLLKNDFIYIFYPNSFLYLSLIAFLFHKPYGIYLRGEQGINLWFTKFIFKRATIILTVHHILLKK